MAKECSRQIYEESLQYTPGGVHSPVRAFQEVGIAPIVADRGSGALLYDCDERVYIDYCMSWGALILGHTAPSVVTAVQKQMAKGSSFGLLTPLEVALCKEISTAMPSIESLRFVSSGTEATMSALRVARGYTGKDVVIKFIGNYHGHADPFLVRAGSGTLQLSEATSLGVPQGVVQSTLCLPYNQSQTVKELFRTRSDIAAVIVEPIAANMGLVPAQEEFLETLRRETNNAGALLIFDEVVSGFRVGRAGAQGFYGIEPDLTCLGKIIGGGLPCAAFGGRKEIMNCLAPLGAVYQAGTLSGNPLAMQAGLAVLNELTQEAYDMLEEKSAFLLDPLSALLKECTDVHLSRLGSCFTLFFQDFKVFQHFYQFLLSHGIYFPPSPWETCFISLAHEEQFLAHTQQVIAQFLQQHLL